MTQWSLCPLAWRRGAGAPVGDALDTVSEGLLVLDTSWRVLFANVAAGEFTGHPAAEMLGRTLWELFPEAETRRFGAEYRRSLAENVPVTFEEFYPDPLNKWYEVRAYPSAEGLSIFFRDVTERRRMEAALRVNLTKYSVLFRSFPLAISVTDDQGRLLEVNPEGARLLGLSEQDLKQRRIDSTEWPTVRLDGTRKPPEEFASVRALKEQRVVENVEMGLTRPDGDVTWISVSSAPLPLEGYGVVTTYGDITPRRRAEQEIEEAHRQTLKTKARLEAVMDALPTGLAVIEANGSGMRANDAFHRIWGKGRPTTRKVGKRVRYVACTQPQCGGGTCAISGTVMEIEQQGRRTYVLNSAAPIAGEDRRPAGCAIAIQDVTRLVEMERALTASEAALQRSNDKLAAANSALRQNNETLEARVAIRTKDLARRTVQLKALARDLTRAEERERDRIAQVIHDHLQQRLSVARINVGIAYGQAEAEPMRKALETVDALIADSLEMTRTLTAEISPGILHRSGLAAGLRWLGDWYAERFALDVEVEAEEVPEIDEQVRVTVFRSVRELLFNVAKHARVTTARVQLTREPGGRIRAVVSDAGAGFDPGAVRAREGKGGGFGLFSVRERIELLGGGLEIDSAPGRGTTMTILAPACERADDEVGRP